jgi:hypothetical protein
MEPASTHLRAELLPRRLRGWAKARHYVAMVAAAALGEIPATHDLVVFRRESGAEIMRTPADVGSPEFLLDQVNADLESKTVTEFLSEWRLDVEPNPPVE